jgi:CHASE2 domain-containing sensor protein
VYTAFIIYLVIVGIIIGVILSKKFREVLAIVLVAAVLFAFVLTLHGAARAENVVEGVITRVAPEFFNDYPILVVTVETFDGEVYTYYSEDEIDVQGIVVLTIFEEEVLNVE